MRREHRKDLDVFRSTQAPQRSPSACPEIFGLFLKKIMLGLVECRGGAAEELDLVRPTVWVSWIDALHNSTQERYVPYSCADEDFRSHVCYLAVVLLNRQQPELVRALGIEHSRFALKNKMAQSSVESALRGCVVGGRWAFTVEELDGELEGIVNVSRVLDDARPRGRVPH